MPRKLNMSGFIDFNEVFDYINHEIFIQETSKKVVRTFAVK